MREAKGNADGASLQPSNFAENCEVLRPLLGGFRPPIAVGEHLGISWLAALQKTERILDMRYERGHSYFM
ncbi:hypothetical protein Krac_6139 [Ktedonobacter racemifer DSM 44963]|uniref:Uncharacterized protein n=1 Tax=Ktedonobacter racemifer DSM 44963 TaxID=485913 RepID=D6TY11_KTERA|nr:hypothetical protein Krac_6139 [Ktedonobacter racemifer DSM 44963]